MKGDNDKNRQSETIETMKVQYVTQASTRLQSTLLCPGFAFPTPV